MTYPYFTKGLSDRPSTPAREIATLDRAQMDDAANYVVPEGLSHAVNVALTLGMPLLVTGEPGCGKTQLAFALAHELQAEPVLKFETKSTSAARDLFYTFDALTAFKVREAYDPRHFIEYGPLGRAILEAFAADHPGIRAFLPGGDAPAFKHNGPRRSVVLIDEVDKAPRDFPNDLLNEIERLYFRVPELRNIGTPGADSGRIEIPPKLRPIIIVTSNSEKNLPEPFLRRCIYYHIDFPAQADMERIVAMRVAGLAEGSTLLASAVRFFYDLRSQTASGIQFDRMPSTAEFINWLQILMIRDAKPGDDLQALAPLVLETITTLGKTSDDQKAILTFATNTLKGK
ncbi:MAG TPA: hypothetical protein DCL54_07520 [Alphaproteobacteria bacterium]|nr:hypothetical protein [Alphaproteobacteria bacterium]